MGGNSFEKKEKILHFRKLLKAEYNKVTKASQIRAYLHQVNRHVASPTKNLYWVMIEAWAT